MASRKALIESELLLLQHRRGVPDALEALVALWERPLYYYLRKLVGSEEEAREIAQETWLIALRKIRSLRDPAAFPAWLYRIARSQVASHFRSSPRFVPLPDESAPDAIPVDDGRLPSLNAEELHWGLGMISPLHSECVILHYLEDFSLEDVAQITGVPVGTVKSRIHYAKKALRQLLSKEADDGV